MSLGKEDIEGDSSLWGTDAGCETESVDGASADAPSRAHRVFRRFTDNLPETVVTVEDAEFVMVSVEKLSEELISHLECVDESDGGDATDDFTVDDLCLYFNILVAYATLHHPSLEYFANVVVDRERQRIAGVVKKGDEDDKKDGGEKGADANPEKANIQVVRTRAATSTVNIPRTLREVDPAELYPVDTIFRLCTALAPVVVTDAIARRPPLRDDPSSVAHQHMHALRCMGVTPTDITRNFCSGASTGTLTEDHFDFKLSDIIITIQALCWDWYGICAWRDAWIDILESYVNHLILCLCVIASVVGGTEKFNRPRERVVVSAASPTGSGGARGIDDGGEGDQGVLDEENVRYRICPKVSGRLFLRLCVLRRDIMAVRNLRTHVSDDAWLRGRDLGMSACAGRREEWGDDFESREDAEYDIAHAHLQTVYCIQEAVPGMCKIEDVRDNLVSQLLAIRVRPGDDLLRERYRVPGEVTPEAVISLVRGEASWGNSVKRVMGIRNRPTMQSLVEMYNKERYDSHDIHPFTRDAAMAEYQGVMAHLRERARRGIARPGRETVPEDGHLRAPAEGGADCTVLCVQVTRAATLASGAPDFANVYVLYPRQVYRHALSDENLVTLRHDDTPALLWTVGGWVVVHDGVVSVPAPFSVALGAWVGACMDPMHAQTPHYTAARGVAERIFGAHVASGMQPEEVAALCGGSPHVLQHATRGLAEAAAAAVVAATTASDLPQ